MIMQLMIIPLILLILQALQLRRRNEELLDLQRNHEAFREKFVLFREVLLAGNPQH